MPHTNTNNADYNHNTEGNHSSALWLQSAHLKAGTNSYSSRFLILSSPETLDEPWSGKQGHTNMSRGEK